MAIAAVVLYAAAAAADAPRPARVHRIGVLEFAAPAASTENLQAFREGLADRGYVEGRDVVIDGRFADGRSERLLDLAAELVRVPVDVIVTRGTPAALAARQATRTIPIVMASSGDPVAEGVVTTVARPGGNVTGLHIMAPPEIGGRRLQLLREVAPGISRVGILWNSATLHAPSIVGETRRVGAALGVRVESLEFQRPEALEQAFERALTSQVDGFIAVEDSLTFAARTPIAAFATMSRLPAIYGLREFVDAGGLMSYGTDRRDLFRRSAGYVDRILKGAPPGELPIEPPRKFELAINLRTARALGLTIPASLLRRADHVVR